MIYPKSAHRAIEPQAKKKKRTKQQIAGIVQINRSSCLPHHSVTALEGCFPGTICYPAPRNNEKKKKKIKQRKIKLRILVYESRFFSDGLALAPPDPLPLPLVLPAWRPLLVGLGAALAWSSCFPGVPGP